MELTSSASAPMGPPALSSPAGEKSSSHAFSGIEPENLTVNGNQTVGAAAAAQQPKVVQTAFIHKLYK